MLQCRCVWRGIGFQGSACSLGHTLAGDAHDLYYLGGGQDRDQRLCAEDLIDTKAHALHEAAARGAIVLGVCGGYQLLGRSYTLGRERIAGVGLLDAETVRGEGERLIGNVAIQTGLADGLGQRADEREPGAADSVGLSGDGVLAGFENHGGRTTLGPAAQPLGRVLRGHGNDGRSGMEGARQGSVIGTYLHGPLLPKNAWFADWLIGASLSIDMRELDSLDDRLERQAHLDARRAAGL
jgi:lipid II isoglutaminyl synthase (glutamine-hydrolysing)